jgi:hypothetical protein
MRRSVLQMALAYRAPKTSARGKILVQYHQKVVFLDVFKDRKLINNSAL